MEKHEQNTGGLQVIGILPSQNGGYEPCPDLLTEEETIRFLRLNIDGPSNPKKTLQYYREKGLLRATRVGKRLRYQRKELLLFLDRITDHN